MHMIEQCIFLKVFSYFSKRFYENKNEDFTCSWILFLYWLTYHLPFLGILYNYVIIDAKTDDKQDNKIFKNLFVLFT